MEGYLFVDKPAGWTSFDVVKYVRSVAAKKLALPARKIKVGHSGTLDPFATGLMIILVGAGYTKRAETLLKLDKTYEAQVELGKISSTGDPEGEIEVVKPLVVPSDQELSQAVDRFIGEVKQIPPAYSAIKVNGVRAYKLARENKEVNIEPRTIRVDKLEIESYSYPIVKIRTEVSSGTYIRSLVADLGAVLKTGAYTRELKRTAIGNCSIEQAVAVKQINEQTIEQLLKATL